MNIDKEIERIKSKIVVSTVSSFVTMYFEKSDAVKVANFFRQDGYGCVIISGFYQGIKFHQLTISKRREKGN